MTTATYRIFAKSAKGTTFRFRVTVSRIYPMCEFIAKLKATGNFNKVVYEPLSLSR